MGCVLEIGQLAPADPGDGLVEFAASRAGFRPCYRFEILNPDTDISYRI